MDELPLRLKTFLTEAAERLRAAGLPKALPEAMERLSGQVEQPCVVAVVGLTMRSFYSSAYTTPTCKVVTILGEVITKGGSTVRVKP